ncbi:MAG: RNA polymerase sporulation sigma factor SigK [Eubacterium sp.]|nr:RNA polymerase sporulation sigma factor SigK [Eubacterium sp.]
MQSFEKPLRPEEEKRYLEKYREGDRSAREKLIEHNLRLVAHIVKKYHSPERDLDDLISIGTIGLIKAVNTFDQTKGKRLATYAARCIDNELLMMLRQEKKLSREVSLYEPVGTDQEGNHISLMDILCTDDMEIVEQYIYKSYLQYLDMAVESLDNERDREIILMRYGLRQYRPHTQKEVAAVMNISRSYVSRIEKRTLQKLKDVYEQGPG